MASNANLGAAKRAKNDEFYTRWEDIEAEMNAYVGFNRDVFRDKVVLLPCDDPEWSQFTRYFAANFEWFGLKKLISTSYAKGAGNRRTTDFERAGAAYDEALHAEHGKVFTLERGEGPVDINHLTYEYLDGDGDFRSDEVRALRDEADFVISNPPFSLWREFLAWILEANKKFIIIGSINAVTYKEVFPLLKDNKIWAGAHFNTTMEFIMDDSYELKGKAYVDEQGRKHGFVAGVAWFTNVELAKRHETLQLDTMANNLRFNKKLKRTLEKKYGFRNHYPRYDNYDAIEVPLVECIPSDYDGVMGVPITFLDRYNPEQFEILGYTAKDLYPCDKFYMDLEQSLNQGPFVRNMKSARFSPMVQCDARPENTCYRASNADGFLQKTYGRVLIRPITH